MKTILVVYNNVNKLSASLKASSKRYSFNTSADVEEGDIIESNAYDTKMHVVAVLDEKFNYYNRTTGELRMTMNSSELRDIKTLEIGEADENVVFGTVTNKKKDD